VTDSVATSLVSASSSVRYVTLRMLLYKTEFCSELGKKFFSGESAKENFAKESMLYFDTFYFERRSRVQTYGSHVTGLSKGNFGKISSI